MNPPSFASDEINAIRRGGTIVVVAKCPVPGQSKTRLAPLLGEQGAADLARAMLCDVLSGISNMPELDAPEIRKILLFAPSSGDALMKHILQDLGILSQWQRIPMLDQGEGAHQNLQSSDLGAKLTHALESARREMRATNNAGGKNGPVIFLGMDSPELPLDEILHAIQHSQEEALLCPAIDGGYGMLSVPAHVNTQEVFMPLSAGKIKRWSTPLTALAQIKALTDAGIKVRLGRLMHDMDDESDVASLVERLRPNAANRTTETEKEEDVLLRPSRAGGKPRTADCHYTRLALQRLGQL